MTPAEQGQERVWTMYEVPAFPGGKRRWEAYEGSPDPGDDEGIEVVPVTDNPEWLTIKDYCAYLRKVTREAAERETKLRRRIRELEKALERVEKACKNGTRENKDGACAALTKLLQGDEPYSDVHGKAIERLSMAFNRLEGDVLHQVEAVRELKKQLEARR